MALNTAHEKLINEILAKYGSHPRWRIWKNNTGSAYRDGRLITYGLKGSADIFGITRDGKFVALEIKTGRGVQSKEQLEFENMITLFGGWYKVIRCMDHVRVFLEKI